MVTILTEHPIISVWGTGNHKTPQPAVELLLRMDETQTTSCFKFTESKNISMVVLCVGETDIAKVVLYGGPDISVVVLCVGETDISMVVLCVGETDISVVVLCVGETDISMVVLCVWE